MKSRSGNLFGGLAAIEYHGVAGSSLDCEAAVVRLLQAEDTPASARILTCMNTHCLLLINKVGDHIAVKSGFTSGYSGTGPTCFSKVLHMLQKHGCEIEECQVDQKVLDRLDASALTKKDVESIVAIDPIRPSRWFDYILKKHLAKSNEANIWREFKPTMPYALIDDRLFDLSLSFWENPDDCLLKGYRCLEDLVRSRTNSQDHGHKLFSKAFLSGKSLLYWDGIDEGEQTGRASLFIATFMAHRNPRAHRHLEQDARKQLGEFLLLNHLFVLEAEAVDRPISVSE